MFLELFVSYVFFCLFWVCGGFVISPAFLSRCDGSSRKTNIVLPKVPRWLDGTALEILGAAERKNAFYLLGKPLKKEKEIAPTFTCWSRLVNQTTITLLPVEDLPRCDSAALHRVECHDTKNTVFLLLG